MCIRDRGRVGFGGNRRVLNNGKWAAIVGNGPGGDASDASAGQAQLFVLYLDGPGSDGNWDLGTDYLRITTGVGTDTDRNALYTPIAIDAYWSSGNPDGKADVFYAGDEYGNLWRFDLSGTSAAAWKTPSQPLFAGDRARPITALPVKSMITRPAARSAQVETGRHVIRGLAWSGAAPVSSKLREGK